MNLEKYVDMEYFVQRFCYLFKDALVHVFIDNPEFSKKIKIIENEESIFNKETGDTYTKAVFDVYAYDKALVKKFILAFDEAFGNWIKNAFIQTVPTEEWKQDHIRVIIPEEYRYLVDACIRSRLFCPYDYTKWDDEHKILYVDVPAKKINSFYSFLKDELHTFKS